MRSGDSGKSIAAQALRLHARRMKSRVGLAVLLCLSLLASARSADLPAARADQLRDEYFRAETALLEKQSLAAIQKLEDWSSTREERRRRFLEMLGLWPMPERTDLKAVTTGRIEREDFTVEKVHFQALPRVYVTANLYLPKNLQQPAPAILYACGHGRVVTNGVSCGNKTAYQHHGIWFARNGFVALLIDTLQLGEIEGLHHGTYRENQWWWNSRGYTPAGVEAWFGTRAIDYLCSRPEVDRERIGMTGRSGGGAYTWTTAAIDERVKVAAPVAGITDLRNHIVDGVVRGHCDCMFHLNTYRWDFPEAAALLAPRPLLIANSDKDTIFPLDGVVRLHRKVRGIYDLYGKSAQLGLLITEGPHLDTQDLQVPVFRWFNRFLKGEQPLIEMAARKLFPPEQLRVFGTLPEDQLNTRLAEIFVPAAPPGRQRTAAEWAEELRRKVFAGWPAEGSHPTPGGGSPRREGSLAVRRYELPIAAGVAPSLWVVQSSRVKKPRALVLNVIDGDGWTNSPGRFLWDSKAPSAASGALARQIESEQCIEAFFVPRDVEPSPQLRDPREAAQVRRRYMLLGQTQDGMRVWDLRCAMRALQAIPEFRHLPLHARARGNMGINAAYAALFEPGVARLELADLPASHLQGPDYLNVLKVWDIPQLLETLGTRAAVQPAAPVPAAN